MQVNKTAPALMQLRSVEYLCALARERHFARAADACGVSQPTLSAGLSALEEQLGHRLVIRDRRFVGLTPEGQAVLPIAQQLLATLGAMRQAVAGEHRALTGELRLGAIPAALPAVGAIGHALAARHPALQLSVLSMTSRQIEQGLDAYELDAGITYLESEPLAQVLQVELYRERYMLVAPRAMQIAPGAVDWAQAAALPLCLLPLSMQNRRILDARLAQAGAAARPRATANSYVALIAMLRMGALASIMPDSYASYVEGDPLLTTREIVGQASGTAVGLVVRDRQPLAPLPQAALTLGGSDLLRRGLEAARRQR